MFQLSHKIMSIYVSSNQNEPVYEELQEIGDQTVSKKKKSFLEKLRKKLPKLTKKRKQDSIPTNSNTNTVSNNQTDFNYEEISIYCTGEDSFSWPLDLLRQDDDKIYEDLDFLREDENVYGDVPLSFDSNIYESNPYKKVKKTNNDDQSQNYDEMKIYVPKSLKKTNPESKLAFDLFFLCQPNNKEKDLFKTAVIFHKLGVLYNQKSPDKIALIRAAALFNAARCRSYNMFEKSTQRLHALGTHIQTLAKVNQKEDLVAVADDIAERISVMRTNVKKALEFIKQIPKNLEKNALRNCEEEKIKAVRNIQHFVTQKYLNIMAHLSRFCELIMGNPPCSYAVVGMGSLARKEITPYSDFEHVVVLKEGCQNDCKEDYEKTLEYFRWYSVMFHVVILNLKETIIPSMAIPSLNDDSTKLGNWFFDAVTKRGISFDGMMPHASKFPLGISPTANKPFTTELIKPVSEMLKYLNSDEILKRGYHLGDILTKTCFVHGDEGVFTSFDKGVKEKIEENFKTGNFDQLQRQIEEDLEKFAVGEKALALLTLKSFNIKQLIYRTTTLFISAWGQLEGISANSSFDIVVDLYKKGLISDEQKHKLMYAVALACETRLRVYMQKDRQDDIYTAKDDLENTHFPFLNIIGQTSLINYFQIAYALQLTICKKINVKPVKLLSNPNMFNAVVCTSLGLQELANQFVRFNVASAAPNVDIFNFTECLSYLEEGIRLNFNNITGVDTFISSSLPTSEKDKHELAYRCSYYAKHLYLTEAYEESLELLLYTINILKRSHKKLFYASCCELAGCCLTKMGSYSKAWYYFEKVLQIHKTISVDNESSKDIDQVVLTHHNLGVCLIQCSQYAKASTHLHNALSVYENQKLSENIAEVSFYIGMCSYKWGKLALSAVHLKRSLNIYQEIIKAENFCTEYVEAIWYFIMIYNEINSQCIDISEFRLLLQYHVPNIYLCCDISSADTLFKIGNCLLDLKFYDFSFTFLIQALNCYTKLIDKAADGYIACLHSTIGLCLMGQEKHNEALVYLYDSLSMFQVISKDVKNDIDVAMAFEYVSLCLLEMKQFKDSYINFQKSLDILIQIPVKNSSQRLAAVHNSMGVCLIEMRKHEEALIHFESSRNIKSGISFKVPHINDQVITLNNMGKCMMKLHKYGEATEVFREALNLQEQPEGKSEFAERHADRREQQVWKQDLPSNKALTLNNLSLCLAEMNNLEDSFRYLNEAYELCSQALVSGLCFGQETRKQMADTLNNLGLNYIKAKAYNQAIDCFNDSLSYYNSILTNDENSEDVCLVWNNLGLSFMSMKQHQKAIHYFKTSLEFFEASTNSNYSETKIAALCNNIGLCQMQCALPIHSLQFFVKSLSLYQKSTPSTNRDVAAVIHNIALVYMNLGELEESFQFLKNALDVYRHSCDELHSDPDVAEILHSMGLCKKRMGEFAEGLSYFEQSLSIRTTNTTNEIESKDLIRLLYNSGICLSALDHDERSSFKKNHFELTLKCLRDFM